MISVVLPTYNGEQYLSESINSIINQTYSDWELIIVDDCSTDSTAKIADEYALRDSRIRVIHNHQNMKLPKSLNIGFDNANGECYTWTSDDNRFAPDAFDIMIEYLHNNPSATMVCTAYDLIDENGCIIGESAEYNPHFMLYNNVVGACFMYHSYVKNEIGKYDESLFGIEDYDYWLRIQEKYGPNGYIKSKHYEYRLHESSLTSKKFREIKRLLNSYRSKRMNMLFESLKSDKPLLCGLYFDMLISDAVSGEWKQAFVDELPILKAFIEPVNVEKPVIIYGAGDFGNKAYEILQNKVAFFADRNEKMVGTRKHGIPIISYDEMREIKKDYLIIISVGSNIIYSIADAFLKDGIEEMSTYQQLEKERIRNG